MANVYQRCERKSEMQCQPAAREITVQYVLNWTWQVTKNMKKTLLFRLFQITCQIEDIKLERWTSVTDMTSTGNRTTMPTSC